MSWIYDFHYSKHKWLKSWEVSGVVRAESGNPFTPLLSFDNSGTATFLDRPNLTGDPRVHGSRTQLYTASAFAIPTPGTFGNLARNSLVGPGLYSWDVSLIKRIPVFNDRYIELRAEVYNLFNHPNFRAPVNFIDEPAFGSVSATDRDHGRRKVQLGIRFTF